MKMMKPNTLFALAVCSVSLLASIAAHAGTAPATMINEGRAVAMTEPSCTFSIADTVKSFGDITAEVWAAAGNGSMLRASTRHAAVIACTDTVSMSMTFEDNGDAGGTNTASNSFSIGAVFFDGDRTSLFAEGRLNAENTLADGKPANWTRMGTAYNDFAKHTPSHLSVPAKNVTLDLVGRIQLLKEHGVKFPTETMTLGGNVTMVLAYGI